VIILHDLDDVRHCCDAARRAGRTVGLVPTMGGFHDGHRSLMRAARAGTDLVVVSLFVNPTQFGPNEDLAGYPRDLDRDAAVATAEDVDVLFAPTVDAMYPDSPRTTVHVAGLTERLCGTSRPTHFDGVATVVTKLFSIVGHCTAYFGRKDAQQLAVVRRLTTDLNLPVDVVGCPLLRDLDGVALSSRNAYLDPSERRAATVLVQALRHAADAIRAGERDAAAVRDLAATTIAGEPQVRLDYAAVVDADTIEPVTRVHGSVLVAVAAFVGPARLIDNLAVHVTDDRVVLDLGVVAEEQRA
jgi:pantoate--beta-alanine ligase